MSDALKQAATILAQSKRLGAVYTVTYREAGNPYYLKQIHEVQAHAFGRKLAEGLEPVIENFVVDQRDIDMVGIEYRAELVVLTKAQFNDLCRAVNTAIRLDAMRSMEISPRSPERAGE